MGVRVREKLEGSGVYWIFINHRGKRTSRQVGSLKAATKVKENIEARLKLGQEAIPKEQPKAPTLNVYWSGYEETYLPLGIRESTIDSYTRSFKNHILPILGEVPLDELTREKVKAFVGSLLQKRFAREVKTVIKDESGEERVEYTTIERALSRSSIRIIMAALAVALNHAKEDGIITTNPAGRLGKLYKQAPTVHAEIQPLSHAEVPIFLEIARASFPDCYPLFLCAIHTGMRSGELAGLEWGDIDFVGKFLTVRRNFSRGQMGKTKTDQIRRVDVSDSLLEELKALKVRRKTAYLAKGKNEIPESVFCNKDGQPPDMHNLKTRFFLKCLEKAKLRRIRFHDLRHTFASLLIQNGESLAYVKDQLGHSSIKMTVDVYGHLVPGANRAAVNRLPTVECRSMPIAVSVT